MPKTTSKTEAEIAAARKAKNDKFRELGAARVNAAIDKVRLLKNLANKNTYDFSSEEVDKLVGALKSEVKAVEVAFETALAGGKAKSDGFNF